MSIGATEEDAAADESGEHQALTWEELAGQVLELEKYVEQLEEQAGDLAAENRRLVAENKHLRTELDRERKFARMRRAAEHRQESWRDRIAKTTPPVSRKAAV